MSSSRLARTVDGRLVAIVTTPGGPCLAGTRLLVLGNLIPVSISGEPGRFAWLGERTGRPSGERPSRRPVEPPVEQRCEQCSQRYTIAARNARRGARPLCRLCRGMPEPPTPTQADFDYWTTRFSGDELRVLAGGLG